MGCFPSKSRSTISCSIKDPPPRVKDIHNQILTEFKSKNKVEFTVGFPACPTLVTVNNSSRTRADIDRDLEAANLSRAESENIIVLRIIPTGDPHKKVEEARHDNIKQDI